MAEDPSRSTTYAQALKAPRIRESAARLADQARDGGWTHEEYLAAVLSREVAAREASGAATCASAPPGSRPARSLEDFNFDHQPGAQPRHDRAPGHRRVPDQGPQRGPARPARHRQDPPRHRLGHQGRPAGPPGRCSPPPSTGSPDSRPPTNAGRLPAELAKLRRYGLLIVDEVGYIPFEQDAANLFFQLVSSRYEHASLILTSNLPFARWGDVFGDQVVAAAMIDRIVHHAEVLTLKGSSYRLKHTGSTPCPAPDSPARHTRPTTTWPSLRRAEPAHYSTSVDTHLERTLGTELSHETISNITDAVLAEVNAWQSRPLEPVYPILYLDALVVKVKESHQVRNKAAHIAVGVDTDGIKQCWGSGCRPPRARSSGRGCWPSSATAA